MTQFYNGRLVFFAAALFVFVLSACDKNMIVSLDRNLNDELDVTVIDSLTVGTSTFQLNYLDGAEQGILLVGKATQSEIGSVTSTAYFELGLQDYVAGIPENAVFDSVSMILRPHFFKYSYGDTTAINKISIHRLTEKMETVDRIPPIDAFRRPFYYRAPTIFNDKQFDYDDTALGKVSFLPRLHRIDTIAVRLDQSFGEDMFDLMRNSSNIMTSSTAFVDYLNGMVIVPDNNNKAIIGLKDTVEVRFNYSFVNASGFKVSNFKKISLSNKKHQYNNIAYDRSGTPFAGLSETNRELTSAETNGKLFLQAGTGVVTKLNLKSLQNLMRQSNIAINKIELQVETSSQIDGPFPGANRLMLMIANSNGVPVGALTEGSSVLSSMFTPGDLSGINGIHRFDLSQYAKVINREIYNDATLFLSPINTNLFNRTNALIIAKDSFNKPKIKLNIIYTKFQ